MKLAAYRIINGERKAQGERQICSPSLIQNESGDKMMLQKKKSGFILLEAVLAILLMSMASYGLAMTSALQFNQLEAKQVANEAEQYAMNEVEYLRRVGFDDLDEALHDRKSNLEFSGVDGWESVTSFVTEKAIDDDRSIKIAKVEVYKEGENIPRYSMEVPLSSQGNSFSNFNIVQAGYANHGTIIPKPKNYQHMKNLQCLLSLSYANMKNGDNLHGVTWYPYVTDNGDHWTVYIRINDWGKRRNGVYYGYDCTVVYIIVSE